MGFKNLLIPINYPFISIDISLNFINDSLLRIHYNDIK